MITTVVSFVLVLGLLIFIHELGHFSVAKWSGVGVEKFSLGFGPRLVGFRMGETEYQVSILPLGGYVKMIGESLDDEVSEEDKRRSFSHKPLYIRAAIVGAGPVMNLVLAALLMPFIYLIGINAPAYLLEPAVVGFVEPGDPADTAGIIKGDLVVAVDGSRVSNWEEFFATFALSPGTPLTFTVERDGGAFDTVLTPETSEETGAGYVGIFPPMRPIIGDLSPGYPAEEAGMRTGDLVLSIDGVEITHWAELEDLIQKGGDEKDFVVLRDGHSLEIEITPRYDEGRQRYLVGITRLEEQVLRQYGVGESITRGFASAADMTGRLFMVLKGLVVGQYSLKTLGGPIMIAQVAGKAAQSGIADLLFLVSFLSLQLGIINLFPIPVLDGGHLLFFSIEGLKGRPLSDKVMGTLQQVGVVLLIVLMVLVTYNDIFRIFG